MPQRREIFSLPPLRCEIAHCRDVLAAIAHTIVFTRALGCGRPRDERGEKLDVHYVACGDAAADGKIRDAANSIVTWALKTGGGEADVTLSFYERDRGASTPTRSLRDALARSSGSWKRDGGASGYWEQWRIGLEIFRGEELDDEARARASEALRDQVVGTQRHVLSLVNEMKAHVPPVTTSDVLSFPFEITVPVAQTESPGSFGRGILERLASLSSTPPSMM